MSDLKLYRGHWPQNISKTAKYSVRYDGGKWKVTIQYDLGDGLRYLAVEDTETNIVEHVNKIKNSPGGVFYINEYQHLIVPVKDNDGTVYYVDGKVDSDFKFEFEGNILTPKPVNKNGTPLDHGDKWDGPRAGIPYILAAGGGDIYFKSPALTDTDPPTIRERVTRKVKLSKALNNADLLKKVIQPILDIRGPSGGRFYVNEHCAIFTPRKDEESYNYIYCGQIDLDNWFPEPEID